MLSWRTKEPKLLCLKKRGRSSFATRSAEVTEKEKNGERYEDKEGSKTTH
jgi:hypothetical protein